VIFDIGVNVSMYLKLFGRENNYFRSIRTSLITVPERHRQTDGRTDRHTTYCGITA